MQIRSSNKEQPEINLTSLIDVVFLLLIFFMISTTFERSSTLKVSLPEATSSAVENQPATIVLAIDSLGRMAVDDRPVAGSDAVALNTALAAVWDDDGNDSLIIEADAETAHRFVVMAMDVASQLGITKLSIATINIDAGGTDQP